MEWSFVTDVLDEVNALKRAVEEAEKRKARAEANKEAITEALRATLTALKDDFGVTTLEDARKMLESLEADTAKATAELAALLKDA